MQILVKKMDGELEPFDIEKLKNSLKNAGASQRAVDTISEHIEKELYPGVTTQEIYAHAFEILKHFEKKPVAARYSLKRAIFDLGPSGFPFEQFVSSVFKELGYKHVKVGVQMQGSCAPHELDIYAEKNGKSIGAELKFHNTPGFKTDLKVALYVWARFKDLLHARHKIDDGWLITNTRFTKNVIKFAKCSGLKILGWDYPYGNGLVKIIERSKVHPITALTTLKASHKKMLIERDVVTCKQALKILNETGSLGISHSDISAVEEELISLCENNNQ